jgi:hypothetical protein
MSTASLEANKYKQKKGLIYSSQHFTLTFWCLKFSTFSLDSQEFYGFDWMLFFCWLEGVRVRESYPVSSAWWHLWLQDSEW